MFHYHSGVIHCDKCLHLCLLKQLSVTLQMWRISICWAAAESRQTKELRVLIFCLSIDWFVLRIALPSKGFVVVKPSWASFRKGGPSWRELALTAVAIKWKLICGRLYGFWNSTVLWGQISCPLHQSIQGHRFLRWFNLRSAVWLVMIQTALCSSGKIFETILWCLFLTLIFKALKRRLFCTGGLSRSSSL